MSCIDKVEEFLSENDPLPASTIQILIVDDNMYQHSMRRQIYTLASRHDVRTIVVWFNTDPSVAFSRNQCRSEDRRVSQESFSRIASQFEAPDRKYIADRYYVEVRGDDDYQ